MILKIIIAGILILLISCITDAMFSGGHELFKIKTIPQQFCSKCHSHIVKILYLRTMYNTIMSARNVVKHKDVTCLYDHEVQRCITVNLKCRMPVNNILVDYGTQ